jgi:hypothetical protein
MISWPLAKVSLAAPRWIRFSVSGGKLSSIERECSFAPSDRDPLSFMHAHSPSTLRYGAPDSRFKHIRAASRSWAVIISSVENQIDMRGEDRKVYNHKFYSFATAP